MAASAGAIQCAAAMVVMSGNGGLEITKIKTKRQTVSDCEETLRALEVKREQLIARGESLPELRRGAAFAAHVEGNAEARRALDKVAAEVATHASELASIDDASRPRRIRFSLPRHSSAGQRQSVQ